MANSLGRGLDSLIPNKVKKVKVGNNSSVVDVSSPDERNKILYVSPNDVVVNPYQPRKRFVDHQIDELAESIKEHGIIQPLITSREPDGSLQLIAGERRLRASKQLGLETVPVIVRDADKQEKLEIALIENLQRENLNPIETALAYQKLIDEFNLTQEQVSKQASKSRSSIANSLRLLHLPEEIQLALIDGRMSPGHAKVVAGLDNEVKQMKLFRKIVHENMSVNATSEESRRIGGTKSAKIKINYKDKDKEFAFREFFQTKAEIKRGKNGGQIILEFSSDDELENMINKIRV